MSSRECERELEQALKDLEGQIISIDKVQDIDSSLRSVKVQKEEAEMTYHRNLKIHNEFLADRFLPTFKPAMN